MIYIAYIVLLLSFLNLLRMGVFLVGSDVHDIRKSFFKKKTKDTAATGMRIRSWEPLVSVLVPAHNEEKTLQRNLDSIRNSTYKNIELIIINDSSTDRTYNIARSFQHQYRHSLKRVEVLNVQVRGKARALNAGLAYAHGGLFMCLDADSALAPQALAIAVEQFADPTLGCMSSNVKILPSKGILNLFQQIEYLICYQMKKTETAINIQYIVGGIGSMFRTHLVRELGNYDTDTITEDIDLSMKMISHYAGSYRIGYHPDVITYTEAVHDIRGLMRQRFRWKYGRYQTFLKQRHLFWSRDKRHNKILSWLYLPYALLSELLYILEPLIIVLIVYLFVRYGDTTILTASFVVAIFYIVMHITAATNGYSINERIRFIGAAPVAYIGMIVLSFVEYGATIHGFKNLRKIYKDYRSGEGMCEWKHVERMGDIAVR